MDKRSWIWIILFFFVLFGINWYFEQEHAKKVAVWQEQRREYRQNQIERLERLVQRETLPARELPLVSLSSGRDASRQLGTALQEEQFLISLNLVDSPATVYSQGTSYERVSRPDLPFSIYRARADADLPMVSLSNVGQAILQLLRWPEDPLQPPQLILAEYSDGQVTFPARKLQEWWWEEGGEKPPPPVQAAEPAFSLALLKTPQGFQAVGIYDETSGIIREWAEIPSLSALVETPAVGRALATAALEEQFFVLENEFVQLVFSSYGAALAEINLPFQSAANPHSVVKEIEYDRQIRQIAPKDARFPLHPFYTASPDGPIFHAEGKEGGYYPLLRRDLIRPGALKNIRVSPEYYGANIVSDYPEVAQLGYSVTTFEKNRIIFEAEQPYRKIRKTFTLPTEEQMVPYLFEIEIEIEGDRRGLWLTSGVPEAEMISGAPAPSLKYRITRRDKPEVVLIDPPKESITISSLGVDWLSNSNGFFGVILDPLIPVEAGLRVNRVSGDTVPSRLTLLSDQEPRLKPSSLPGFLALLPISLKDSQMRLRVFSGPYDSRILRQVDRALTDPATGANPDFIASQTYHGWFAFISEPFAKLLFVLMNFFHQITGSWGLSIILLTVALRILLYPLNAWSAKSMMKMQLIAPEVQAIQNRYKNDPKKAQLEIMALYREAKVNPLSGCFPLIIQMPFLIGMFDLLKSSFALRGASFIPGWIDNLTAPDVLFTWNTPIPFFGNSFHLLPFILGGLFFLQSRLFSTAPKDVSLMTDQQRQQRAMGSMSAVLFTVIFYNFPSGLNIYFISNNLLGILQQWWTAKQLQKTPIVLGPEKKGKKR